MNTPDRFRPRHPHPDGIPAASRERTAQSERELADRYVLPISFALVSAQQIDDPDARRLATDGLVTAAMLHGISPTDIEKTATETSTEPTRHELRLGKQAVLEAKDLLTEQDMAAGITDSLSIATELLDELTDEAKVYISPDKIIPKSEVKVCTYSCRCPVANPDHQRGVLFGPRKNGKSRATGTVAFIPWDPLGSSAEEIADRDRLRTEYMERRAIIQKWVAAIEAAPWNGYNRLFHPEAARAHDAWMAQIPELGETIKGGNPSIELDDNLSNIVERRRDEFRRMLGFDLQGDYGQAEEVDKTYAARMKQLYTENGFTPPSTQGIIAGRPLNDGTKEVAEIARAEDQEAGEEGRIKRYLKGRLRPKKIKQYEYKRIRLKPETQVETQPAIIENLDGTLRYAHEITEIGGIPVEQIRASGEPEEVIDTSSSAITQALGAPSLRDEAEKLGMIDEITPKPKVTEKPEQIQITKAAMPIFFASEHGIPTDAVDFAGEDEPDQDLPKTL